VPHVNLLSAAQARARTGPRTRPPAHRAQNGRLSADRDRPFAAHGETGSAAVALRQARCAAGALPGAGAAVPIQQLRRCRRHLSRQLHPGSEYAARGGAGDVRMRPAGDRGGSAADGSPAEPALYRLALSHHGARRECAGRARIGL